MPYSVPPAYAVGCVIPTMWPMSWVTRASDRPVTGGVGHSLDWGGALTRLGAGECSAQEAAETAGRAAGRQRPHERGVARSQHVDREQVAPGGARQVREDREVRALPHPPVLLEVAD